MSSSPLGPVMFLMLFVVVLAVAFTSVGNINSATIGNCARNSTGDLVNCSLSDNDFNAINATNTQAGNILNTASLMEWPIILLVMISVFMFLFAIMKK